MATLSCIVPVPRDFQTSARLRHVTGRQLAPSHEIGGIGELVVEGISFDSEDKVSDRERILVTLESEGVEFESFDTYLTELIRHFN